MQHRFGGGLSKILPTRSVVRFCNRWSRVGDFLDTSINLKGTPDARLRISTQCFSVALRERQEFLTIPWRRTDARETRNEMPPVPPDVKEKSKREDSLQRLVEARGKCAVLVASSTNTQQPRRQRSGFSLLLARARPGSDEESQVVVLPEAQRSSAPQRNARTGGEMMARVRRSRKRMPKAASGNKRRVGDSLANRRTKPHSSAGRPGSPRGLQSI